MSYGKGTGEAYLSAITMAFMEDTGHYVAANATGGSLVADLTVTGACGDTGSTTTLDFVFGNYQARSVREGVLQRVLGPWDGVVCVCGGPLIMLVSLWVCTYTHPHDFAQAPSYLQVMRKALVMTIDGFPLPYRDLMPHVCLCRTTLPQSPCQSPRPGGGGWRAAVS